MENTYLKPPRTIMEVYQSLPEGTLAQLINNHIYMSPSPTDHHQRISISLSAQLFNYVNSNNLGEVRAAPYDVHLNQSNVFQPDIVFIARENMHRIKANGLHGAPDLVIEILSPSTQRLDKRNKKNEYERNGLKEYWLIDPRDNSTKGFFMVGNKFEPLPAETGKITFKLLALTVTF